ncbi:MAG: YHYH domain-containing protein [Clostridia bacterium]|nr:YHYH domain-containing protein [Clostridia bacterium]
MKNKRIILLAVILFMCFALGILTFAHPGNTDEYGGHYDRSTGEYHYHHGYPAHQHINGECPYNFVDNTDHSGGSSYFNEELYQKWVAEYEQAQEERKRIESDEAQGEAAGKSAGAILGKETGEEDGLSNNEYKLPKLYSPLYADDNYYYQYASSEYKRAFEKSFESAYKEAYESGYQSGHAVWQKKHDKTVKTIVWSVVGILIVSFVIWRIIANHKEKKRKAE